MGLSGLRLPSSGAVLLECISNLTANELYVPGGAGRNTVQAVLDGVENLLAQCSVLVVVTGDVFSGGSDYQGDTETYLRVLGCLLYTSRCV